jgi:hypothetical protein
MTIPRSSKPQYLFSTFNIRNRDISFDIDDSFVNIYAPPNTFDTSGQIQYYCQYFINDQQQPNPTSLYQIPIYSNALQCSIISINQSVFHSVQDKDRIDITINQYIQYDQQQIDERIINLITFIYSHPPGTYLSYTGKLILIYIGVIIGSVLFVVIFGRYIYVKYATKNKNKVNETNAPLLTEQQTN